MYVVLCYDVVADRRRARLLRKLKGYLTHVQKSVFEGEISPPRLAELRQRVLGLIDPTVDTVRIYQLCARCIPTTEVLGTGVYVESEEEDVII